MTAPSEARSASVAAEPTDQPTELIASRQPPRWRRGWTRRRLLSIGLVVVLVVAAIMTTWLLTRSGSSAASAAPVAVTTQKVTVSTGTIKQTVSASGTIEPASQADLSFAVSGQVTAVKVTVGQKVASGQTLATLNNSALQYQVQAASETLSSDQSRLSSDQSSGASDSQIASDQASVTSAASQLATAQQNLADANLTSTISGTVASINLTVGQQVSSGGSTGNTSSSNTGTGDLGSSSSSSSASSGLGASSSSSSIVVVSTSSYNVNTTVDDTQVSQVKVGDQVTIQAGSSTATVYGTVSSVGLVAQSSGSGSSSVASFPVVVAVTGTPSGLYAGTSATLTITTQQLSNVVEVPTSAISYANGQATVTQVVAGAQKSVPVTTGAAASGETQITSGLKAGDVIMERVVKFNGTSGTGRSLFGGGGTGTRTGGFAGGGFPGGGTGGFAGGGGGFAGGGGGFAGGGG